MDDYNKVFAFYSWQTFRANGELDTVRMMQGEVLEEHEDYIVVVHPTDKEAVLQVPRARVSEIVKPERARPYYGIAQTPDGDVPLGGGPLV